MTSELESRRVLVVPHARRPDALDLTRALIKELSAAGVGIVMMPQDLELLGPGATQAQAAEFGAAGCELAIILGGDGTILRGAELARGHAVPLLGVNLGHVGFLAEVEPDDLPHLVDAVVGRKYHVEERLAIDVQVLLRGERVVRTWALNEASVEKAARERMLEIVAEVDHEPLSRWGCDGVLFSTPTGSTAYAWSVGGPVVWPTVEALMLVPVNAHALFARALVVSPDCELAAELLPSSPPAVLSCDGRRLVELEPGSRVEVRRSFEPVRLARLHEGTFCRRLVAKFSLPVAGWRGRGTARLFEDGGAL